MSSTASNNSSVRPPEASASQVGSDHQSTLSGSLGGHSITHLQYTDEDKNMVKSLLNGDKETTFGERFKSLSIGAKVAVVFSSVALGLGAGVLAAINAYENRPTRALRDAINNPTDLRKSIVSLAYNSKASFQDAIDGSRVPNVQTQSRSISEQKNERKQFDEALSEQGRLGNEWIDNIAKLSEKYDLSMVQHQALVAVAVENLSRDMLGQDPAKYVANAHEIALSRTQEKVAQREVVKSYVQGLSVATEAGNMDEVNNLLNLAKQQGYTELLSQSEAFQQVLKTVHARFVQPKLVAKPSNIEDKVEEARSKFSAIASYNDGEKHTETELSFIQNLVEMDAVIAEGEPKAQTLVGPYEASKADLQNVLEIQKIAYANAMDEASKIVKTLANNKSDFTKIQQDIAQAKELEAKIDALGFKTTITSPKTAESPEASEVKLALALSPIEEKKGAPTVFCHYIDALKAQHGEEAKLLGTDMTGDELIATYTQRAEVKSFAVFKAETVDQLVNALSTALTSFNEEEVDRKSESSSTASESSARSNNSQFAQELLRNRQMQTQGARVTAKRGQRHALLAARTAANQVQTPGAGGGSPAETRGSTPKLTAEALAVQDTSQREKNSGARSNSSGYFESDRSTLGGTRTVKKVKNSNVPLDVDTTSSSSSFTLS